MLYDAETVKVKGRFNDSNNDNGRDSYEFEHTVHTRPSDDAHWYPPLSRKCDVLLSSDRSKLLAGYNGFTWKAYDPEKQSVTVTVGKSNGGDVRLALVDAPLHGEVGDRVHGYWVKPSTLRARKSTKRKRKDGHEINTTSSKRQKGKQS